KIHTSGAREPISRQRQFVAKNLRQLWCVWRLPYSTKVRLFRLRRRRSRSRENERKQSGRKFEIHAVLSSASLIPRRASQLAAPDFYSTHREYCNRNTEQQHAGRFGYYTEISGTREDV